MKNIQHQRHHVRIHQSSLRRLLFIRHIKKNCQELRSPWFLTPFCTLLYDKNETLNIFCYNVLKLFYKAHSLIQEIKPLLPNLFVFDLLHSTLSLTHPLWSVNNGAALHKVILVLEIPLIWSFFAKKLPEIYHGEFTVSFQQVPFLMQHRKCLNSNEIGA